MGATYSPEAVFNQPPPLENYDLFDSDCALREAVHREGGGWIDSEARRLGELLGKPEIIKLGVLANRFAPELQTHDRFGYRIDEVAYHPAYHELMRIGIEARTHSLPWLEQRSGAHVARAALAFLRHQIEEGTSCPLTMTFAAIPSLRLQPELATEWRTPGRQRCTSEHNFGRTGQWWRPGQGICHHGPQMVLLGADV